MAWADHGAPSVDEAMVDEPLEAVLAASWSVKEQTLGLVPVEIAVGVQCSQNREVSCGQADDATPLDLSGSEAELEVGPSPRRKRLHRVREVLRIDIRNRPRN